MLSRSLLVLALVASCGSPPTPPPPAPPSPSPLAAKLDAVVVKDLEGRLVPGISVAVVQHGQTVLSRGYRIADVAAKTPAAPETVYRIGSITKSFTAATILKLAAAGKLSIDDPITRFLPDYDTKGKTITLRHLLTHTSGIKGYTSLDEFQRRQAESFPRSELVAMFAKEPLEVDPGTAWSYSNSGYYLLGLVIEKASGQTYADAVRTLVIEPAGLTSTTYCPDEMTEAGQARGYHVVDDGKVVPSQPLSMAHPYAAGSLCSTAPDLARWAAWLAADRALWTQMTTPATLADGKPTEYGFGLGIGEVAGHKLVSHGGGINGFVSHMSYLPDDELAVVVLSNIEGPAAPEISEALVAVALDLPQPTDLPIAAAEAAPFVGTYEITEHKVKIGVRYQGGSLETANFDDKGQAGRWLPLKWQGGLEFLLPRVKAHLTFVVENGKATSVTIVQGDTFKAVRVAD